MDIASHEMNRFSGIYNMGVCSRILGNIEKSIELFTNACTIAQSEKDLECYVICLCQLGISNLFLTNFDAFLKFSEEFINKNKTLKNQDMELEMLMITGFVLEYIDSYDLSHELFQKSKEVNK